MLYIKSTSEAVQIVQIVFELISEQAQNPLCLKEQLIWGFWQKTVLHQSNPNKGPADSFQWDERNKYKFNG